MSITVKAKLKSNHKIMKYDSNTCMNQSHSSFRLVMQPIESKAVKLHDNMAL